MHSLFDVSLYCTGVCILRDLPFSPPRRSRPFPGGSANGPTCYPYLHRVAPLLLLLKGIIVVSMQSSCPKLSGKMVVILSLAYSA